MLQLGFITGQTAASWPAGRPSTASSEAVGGLSVGRAAAASRPCQLACLPHPTWGKFLLPIDQWPLLIAAAVRCGGLGPWWRLGCRGQRDRLAKHVAPLGNEWPCGRRGLDSCWFGRHRRPLCRLWWLLRPLCEWHVVVTAAVIHHPPPARCGAASSAIGRSRCRCGSSSSSRSWWPRGRGRCMSGWCRSASGQRQVVLAVAALHAARLLRAAGRRDQTPCDGNRRAKSCPGESAERGAGQTWKEFLAADSADTRGSAGGGGGLHQREYWEGPHGASPADQQL